MRSIIRNWVGRSCRFAQAEPRVNLTPLEEKIFQFLIEAKRSFSNDPGELRVAGGWIRDKLLGVESDDIDISVENMTGEEFGSLLKEYVTQYYRRTGSKHPAGDMKSYMTANELKTTGVQIYGQKVEFVHLRSEEYGQESRKPTVEKGTPEEDAFRRDLTINSLFYNIDTGQVEDMTGEGLRDLETMTLRTPLNPKKTFMDDPLRMLRILRFYSRYPNAKLDDDGAGGGSATLEAMSDPEVLDAYRTKVAPERAGPEIIKMMKGKRPSEALRFMFDTGLDKAVFNVPEASELQDLRMDQRSSYHAHDLLEHSLMVVKNINDIAVREGLHDDTRMKMNLAALFHDYGKAHPEIAKPHHIDQERMTYKKHEVKSEEIADAIMKNIGLGDKDRSFVNKIISMHMRPHLFEKETIRPSLIGKLLRNTKIEGYGDEEIKELSPEKARDPKEIKKQQDRKQKLELRQQEADQIWRYVYMHSMADTMSRGTSDVDEDMARKSGHIQQVEEYLSRPPPTKPLVDGHAIMSMFPNLKPGKWIKEVTESLLAKQDAREVTTPEEAQQALNQMRPEIEERYQESFGKKASTWVRANLNL